MYHKVGAQIRTQADTFLNVPVRSFERQIRALNRLGYRGVTLAEAVNGLWKGGALPPKPVCVTFDDGYANVAEWALPIMRERGWPATVFVPTAYVGAVNSWDEPYGHPVLPIMTWEQLGRLQSEGWEMSGHTRTHPKLAELNDDQAQREMRQGKDDLESRLRSTVSTFCYPFGSVGPRTPELCRRAGFQAACTTKSGLARSGADPFLLPRVKIAYRDDVWGLFYRLLIRPHLPG